MRISSILALSLLATSASAADFSITSFSGATPIIAVTGILLDGDDVKFAAFANSLSNGVVELSSPGGKVLPALNIGEIINRKGFITYVPANNTCASACSLIWVAGKPRMASPKARIGFHAVFTDVGGVPTEKGQGNAIVGAYLSKLGFSYEAISFATAASPNEMKWLTAIDANHYGITYTPMDAVSTMATADVPLGVAFASPKPLLAQPMPVVANVAIPGSTPPTSVLHMASKRVVAQASPPKTLQDQAFAWLFGDNTPPAPAPRKRRIAAPVQTPEE